MWFDISSTSLKVSVGPVHVEVLWLPTLTFLAGWLLAVS